MAVQDASAGGSFAPVSSDQPFTIELKRLDKLPRMAWGMTMRRAASKVEVAAGPWVDSAEGFVFEGAWAGSFAEHAPDRSETVFGSGVLVRGSKVVAIAPSHMNAAIYSCRRDDSLFVSNSIAFLLTLADEDIDISYRDYEADTFTSIDGLKKYVRSFPLKSGRSYHAHYFCKLGITRDLEITESRYTASEADLSSFAAYERYLVSQLRSIHACATDSSRRHIFLPAAACSRGYDSSASAALGREIGCNSALVVESKHGGRSDSGRPVVAALGYENILEADEARYRDYPISHEFLGTGELAAGIFHAVLSRGLEGRLFLTGVHGDIIWGQEMEDNPDLVRPHAYAHVAKNEFRLRLGFIDCHTPTIGILRQADVYHISISPEMRPWSVGGDYDRPIARRIVEDRGGRREDFGFSKDGGAGSSLRFAGLRRLRKVMNEADFRDFERFYRKTPKTLHPLRSIVYFLFCAHTFLKTRGLPLPNLFEHVPRRWTCTPWAPSYLYAWAMTRLKPIYRAALKG